jgi:hypothetical protein
MSVCVCVCVSHCFHSTWWHVYQASRCLQIGASLAEYIKKSSLVTNFGLVSEEIGQRVPPLQREYCGQWISHGLATASTKTSCANSIARLSRDLLAEGVRPEIDEGIVLELRQLLVLVSPPAVSLRPQGSADVAKITVYLESADKAASTLFEAFHKFPAMLNMFQRDIESIRTQNVEACGWYQDVVSNIDVLSSIQVPLSEEACPLEEACPRFVEAVDKLTKATASYYDPKNEHFVYLLKEQNSSDAARFTSTQNVAMESIVTCGAASLMKMCDKASKGEYLEDVQRAAFRQGFEQLERVCKTSGDTTRLAQLPDMLSWARYFEKKCLRTAALL